MSRRHGRLAHDSPKGRLWAARALARIKIESDAIGVSINNAPLVLEASDLRAALERPPAADCGVLKRTAERIAGFATAQRNSLQPIEVPVPGGFAGQPSSATPQPWRAWKA